MLERIGEMDLEGSDDGGASSKAGVEADAAPEQPLTRAGGGGKPPVPVRPAATGVSLGH